MGNAEDRTLVRCGHGTESEVRRATVDGIVDTGAGTLMLPQNVVERLYPANMIVIRHGQHGDPELSALSIITWTYSASSATDGWSRYVPE